MSLYEDEPVMKRKRSNSLEGSHASKKQRELSQSDDDTNSRMNISSPTEDFSPDMKGRRTSGSSHISMENGEPIESNVNVTPPLNSSSAADVSSPEMLVDSIHNPAINKGTSFVLRGKEKDDDVTQTPMVKIPAHVLPLLNDDNVKLDDSIHQSKSVASDNDDVIEEWHKEFNEVLNFGEDETFYTSTRNSRNLMDEFDMCTLSEDEETSNSPSKGCFLRMINRRSVLFGFYQSKGKGVCSFYFSHNPLRVYS